MLDGVFLKIQKIGGGVFSDKFRIVQEIGSQILRFRPPNVHQIRKIGSKSSCKLEENRVLQTAHYRPHPRSACCCCCCLLLLLSAAAAAAALTRQRS